MEEVAVELPLEVPWGCAGRLWGSWQGGSVAMEKAAATGVAAGLLGGAAARGEVWVLLRVAATGAVEKWAACVGAWKGG